MCAPSTIGRLESLITGIACAPSQFLFCTEGAESRVTAAELYNYEVDPMEKVNQAGNPGHAEIVERLSAQLEAFLAGQ